MFYFKTVPDGVDWSPTVAIYGDMGNWMGVSMPDLQSEAQLGTIDTILHIGWIFMLCNSVICLHAFKKSTCRRFRVRHGFGKINVVLRFLFEMHHLR